MNIAFRTDASVDIGTGHVMRCLTLAESLRQAGAHCIFLTRDHRGGMHNEIEERGFTVHSLPTNSMIAGKKVTEGLQSDEEPRHWAWLGESWQSDAAQTEALLTGEEIDWIVVDHYALDRRWESRVKPYAKKLLVIDDLADRGHCCDVLIDQNLGREELDYDGLVPDECIRLIGPEYAILRPEFALLRKTSLERRVGATLKNLLIFLGGIDRFNVTALVLNAVENSPLSADCRITIVMGDKAPALEEIQAQTRQMPWPTEVLVNCKNMADVMSMSDLSIGAAGSASWERCCVGLPSIVIVLAENQKDIANALQDRAGIAVLETEEIESGLTELLGRIQREPSYLHALSEASAQITNGDGVPRICKIIENELSG